MKLSHFPDEGEECLLTGTPIGLPFFWPGFMELCASSWMALDITVLAGTSLGPPLRGRDEP